MTRPPSKRVSRGQPIRRGAPAKKSGCRDTVATMGIAALGCAALIVGGLTGGHWPGYATLAAQLPLFAAMYWLLGHALPREVVLTIARQTPAYRAARLNRFHSMTPDRFAPALLRRDESPHVGQRGVLAERPVGS